VGTDRFDIQKTLEQARVQLSSLKNSFAGHILPWCAFALLLGSPFLLRSPTAYADVRVVIFASAYEQAADKGLYLSNTLVDAQSVNKLFRKMSPDVRLVSNPTGEVWQREIDALVARLKPVDIAVVYYAGHAVQVEGQNYFLAADGMTLVAAEDVLSAIMAHSRGAVFFVDACRDNPFRTGTGPTPQSLQVQDISSEDTRQWRAYSQHNLPLQKPHVATVSAAALGASDSGLSQMGNLRGDNAIMFFSTEPGNVASDGVAGKGSPFANAIVGELRKKQSLDVALRSITAQVNRVTQGRQSPWRQGDLGFELFLAGEPRYDVPPVN
jgi:uncharacterized caspase-like protein